MKKIYGFLGAAAILSLASCSNDNFESPVSEGNAEKGDAYINIILSTPPTTRAEWNDDEFRFGEDNENSIIKAQIVFYDAAGNVLQVATVNGTPQNQTSGGNIAVIDKITAIPVENHTKDLAASVIAFVNFGSESVDINLTTLNDKKLQNLYSSANGFAMSNSGFYANDTYRVATPVSISDFYEKGTAETSQPSPVQIYVERLAAKITVPTINNVGKYKVYMHQQDADDLEIELTYTPSGWYAQNIEKSSYYTKHMPESLNNAGYNSDFSTWMNCNYRCHWAQSVGYTSRELTKKAYDDGNDGSFVSGTSDNYISTPSLSNYTPSNIVYVHENTYPGTALFDNDVVVKNAWHNVTSVIIKGIYSSENNNFKEKFTDGTFYLYEAYKAKTDGSGVESYYLILNENEVKEQMLKAAEGIQKTESGTTTSLTSNDVELKRTTDNKYQLVLKAEEGNDYVINGAQNKSVADVNAQLVKITNALKYSEGKAYFAVPLKNYEASQTYNNLTLANVVEGNYGIVRNRWYELSVNKIVGLGTGIADDDDDSDPEIPEPKEEEEKYLINATLNVLQWHMAGQSVDL